MFVCFRGGGGSREVLVSRGSPPGGCAPALGGHKSGVYVCLCVSGEVGAAESCRIAAALRQEGVPLHSVVINQVCMYVCVFQGRWGQLRAAG